MNEKLTLQELIDLLAARHQMEQQDADAFVRAFWTLIEEGLKSDNYVKIKGLGTFKLIDTEARESINIQTGERIEIQSHARITFTPEASLRDQVNRPFSHFETVILNESTNFDDLDDPDGSDGSDEADDKVETDDDNMEVVSVEKEEQASTPVVAEPVVEEAQSPVAEESDEPISIPVVTESAGEEVKPPVEEEQEKPVSTPVVTETVADDIPEENTILEPRKTSGTISLKDCLKQSKRRLSWCMVLCALLAGIVIGGFTSFVILLRNSNLANNPNSEIVLTDPNGIQENVASKRKLPENDGQVVSGTTDVLSVNSANQSEDSLASVMQPKKDTEYSVRSLGSDKDDARKGPEEGTQFDSQENSHRSQKSGKYIAQSEKQSVVSNAETKVEKKYLSEKINYKIVGTLGTHKLRNGETLTRIALKYYGNKKIWPYLVKYNVDVIKNPDNVPIGTTLKIPKLLPESDDRL